MAQVEKRSEIRGSSFQRTKDNCELREKRGANLVRGTVHSNFTALF